MYIKMSHISSNNYTTRGDRRSTMKNIHKVINIIYNENSINHDFQEL